MEHIRHSSLIALFLLACLTGVAQGLDFIDCQDGSITYCTADPEIQLPATNQMIVGTGDPNASSCSAHWRFQQDVTTDCGIIVKYYIDYYPFNGAQRVRLQDTSEAFKDGAQVAPLVLDTRLFGTPSVLLDGIEYNPGCAEDPDAFHRIVWTAIDECGDMDSCIYLVRVVDCQAPMAVPVGFSTVVFPAEQQVTVIAQDFIESAIDDCSPINWLLYSFSKDFFQPTMTINCETIEDNGGPAFEFTIWVVDGGIDENCDGSISWDERAIDSVNALVLMEDDCGGDLFDGKIQSADSVPVPEVLISFFSGPMNQTTTTDDEGEYRLPTAVDTLLDWIVIPTKTGDEPDGVSTLDLVKIQKHLLGIEEFDSPYKRIAADANNNMDISATDLLELRKLILRITTTLPNNTSWRFVKADYVFPDPTDPWPFDEISNLDQLNFIGIKVGDVNGSVTAPPERDPRPVLRLIAEDIYLEAGNSYSIPVSSESSIDLHGIQFTLGHQGLEISDIAGDALDISDGAWVRHKENATVSWFTPYPESVGSDQTMFNIELKASQNGYLSDFLSLHSSLTKSEAYDADERIMDVVLDFERRHDVESGIMTSPNPWSGVTNVRIEKHDESAGVLRVYDTNGSLVMQRKVDCSSVSDLTIHSEELGKPGVYLVQLAAGNRLMSTRTVVMD